MNACRLLVAAVFAFLVAAPNAYSQSPRAPIPRALRFEVNAGQAPPDVLFVARGARYSVRLDRDETIVGTSRGAAAMRLVGANRDAPLLPADLLPGRTNYLVGDPRDWVRGVPSYARVTRQHAYPGIDVVYRGDDGAFRYDFVVSAGASPRAIVMQFSGVSRMRIDRDGDLVLTTSAGEITHRRPIAYQDMPGVRRSVSAGYRLGRRGTVTFTIGRYDHRWPLVIDPTVVRATYFGGNGSDEISALTLDPAGNVYMTGVSASTTFDVDGAPPPAGTGTLLISKITAAGSVEYITLLSPAPPFAAGSAIAVDEAGNLYVSGNGSTLPATPGAPSTTGEGLILKMDSSGSNIVYAVKMPVLSLSDLALMPDGSVIVVGTAGADAPVVNAIQPDLAGNYDGYIARLNQDGTAFIFATYFGGSAIDQLFGVAVDGDGNIHVAGTSESPDFPVQNAQQTYAGEGDVAVAKLTSDGDLVFSTFLGGIHGDVAYAIAVDAANQPIVTGATNSDDFPVRRAFQPIRNPSLVPPFILSWPDAFVTKLSADGTSLVFSTFIGGESGDYGQATQVGPDGDAHVTGLTASVDFPTRRATQPLHGDGASNPFGGGDGFVARFDPIGRPVHCTFFGGSAQEVVRDIAVDAVGTAHVTGFTNSTDLPVVDPLQSEISTPTDGFLLTIADTPCPADVTARVILTPLPAAPLAGGYLRLQFVFITNTSASAISTPASLTVDALTPGMFLLSPGFTFCPATSGAQFATVQVAGNTLAPGQTTLAALLFVALDPGLTLSYTSRLLGGVPAR